MTTTDLVHLVPHALTCDNAVSSATSSGALMARTAGLDPQGMAGSSRLTQLISVTWENTTSSDLVPPRPDLVRDEVTTSSRRPRPGPPSLTGGTRSEDESRAPGEDQQRFMITDEVNNQRKAVR